MSNKWVGTPVTEGTHENLYFNTNLSVEEVVAIIESANLTFEANGVNDGTYTVANETMENYNGYYNIQLKDGCYAISAAGAGIIFHNIPSITSQIGFYGWDPADGGMVSIREGCTLADIGSENDKLSSLISTTPFVKAKPTTVQEAFEDIADAIREKNGEEGTMKSYDMPDKIRALPNGATVTVPGSEGWKGTPVPNSGYVEKIYVNTALSPEEVMHIINDAQLSYIEGFGLNYFVALTDTDPNNNNRQQIMMIVYEGVIAFGDQKTTLFDSDDLLGGGIIGWNPDFNGVVEINTNVIAGEDGYTVGAENDKLSSLFSITPFVAGGGTGESIVLEGDYDGSTVDIDVQAAGGSEPTPVPNSGYVENVYLNTNLSVDEVVGLLSQITDFVQATDLVYTPLHTSTEGIIIIHSTDNDSWFIMNSSGLLFENQNGWLVNTDVIAVNNDAITEHNGSLIGTQNNLLSSLFSITPFTGGSSEPCIDLKPYIENHQIPLKFNLVNIPTGGGEAGGGVVTVTELPPVEEAQEDVIYKIETPLKNRVYIAMVKNGSAVIYPLEEFYKLEMGLTVTIDVIFVDELPTEDIQETNLGNSYMAVYVLNNDGSWHSFMDGEWDEARIGQTYTIVDHEPTVSNIDKSTDGMSQYAWKAEGYDVSKYMFNGTVYIDVTNLTMTFLEYLDRRLNNANYLFAYTDFTYEDLIALKADTVTYAYTAIHMCSDNKNLIRTPSFKFVSLTDITGIYAGCINLVSVEPFDTSLVEIGSRAFYKCESLEELFQIDTAKMSSHSSMFEGCKKLKKADITYYAVLYTSKCTRMYYDCNSITQIIMRSFGPNYKITEDAFTNCYHLTGTVNETYNPNGDKDCYIYVPSAMVDTLKAADVWKNYASQIRALEDYTVDGTTTGKLDESKI